MATQTVNICLPTKLSCSYAGADIILCLPASALLAPVLCPESTSQYIVEGPLGFIYAKIVSVLETVDACQAGYQWLYTVTYDDTLLADPNVPLTQAQVTGAFCKDCLVEFVNASVGNEIFIETDSEGIATLVTQHGCRYVLPSGGDMSLPLLVQDSNSVDLTVAGSPQQTLTANVLVSATAGNVVSVNADGIYVPTPTPSDPVQVTDTQSIDLTIAGSPQMLSGLVRISADVGNQLSLHADGLYVIATSPPPPLDSATSTEDTTSQIANPAVGMQTVDDTIIEINGLGFNPHNYPSQSIIYRVQWRDVEPVQGTYDFSAIVVFLNKCRAANQKVNLRVYESDPGSGYGPPSYLYSYAGWRVTHDDSGATVYDYPYWGNANVQIAHNNFLQALATAIGTHPALGTLDCGWGVYNENNYSGTHYTGTSNGSVPAVGVGNELPNLAASDYQAFYTRFNNTFPTTTKVTFPDTQGSFDFPVGAYSFGARADGWGYRNNPVSCPGAGIQMCTLYPATFTPPGTYPNVWQNNRVALETWNFLYSGGGSWATLGYDYTSSFTWAWATAHASELNIKGQYNVTGGMKTAFETMLRKIGFRYVLRSISHYANAVAGTSINIDTVWENVGSAPNYKDEVILFKMVAGAQVFKVATVVTTKWLPGSLLARSFSIAIPTWLTAATYSVFVGIGDGTPIVPTIQLANNGDDGRFWYDLGTAVALTNATPTAAPSTDFAATFVGASSQTLISTNTVFRMHAATWAVGVSTNWAIGVKVKLTNLLANQTIIAKGNLNVTGQEYQIWYDLATNKFKASISNGTTIYNVIHAASTPLAGQFFSIIIDFNNTTKVFSITVNDLAASTVIATGNIPAGSNVFTVGGNSNNTNFLTGQVTDLCGWLVIPTAGVKTEYARMSGGVALPLRYSEMSNALKYGMLYSFDMAEATGNRVDNRLGLALTDNLGVTRTALN